MKVIASVFGAAALVLSVGHAATIEGMPKTKVSMEHCLGAALEKVPGRVKEVELSVDNGVPHYEFEIVAKGRETEVECDAMTGKIVEVEWENENMDLDAFLAKAKVSPSQARKIALQRVPGKIVRMDLETTSTGVISYEFEVMGRDGKELDVEIDAITGAVIEVERDIYELGDIMEEATDRAD
ncbi:MAG: PepSY domain-containing protein [Betaproteobacteria bacterium]|nr:MAG: PepSY domain-containing protein [Betaproteobacteria bacterium]